MTNGVQPALGSSQELLQMMSQGIQPSENIGMGQAGQVVMVFPQHGLARGTGQMGDDCLRHRRRGDDGKAIDWTTSLNSGSCRRLAASLPSS